MTLTFITTFYYIQVNILLLSRFPLSKDDFTDNTHKYYNI